jgi:hypothetical protein
MVGIYENAELVVSATAAKDGSCGIFGDRKPVQVLASVDMETSSVVREYGSHHHILQDSGRRE